MPAHSHSWANEVPVLVSMLLCARDVSIVLLTPLFHRWNESSAIRTAFVCVVWVLCVYDFSNGSGPVHKGKVIRARL